MSVYIRRLSIGEVHQRQRARSDAEVARHNATVIDLGERRDLRREVLQIFADAQRLSG